ncbi:MAG: ATP-binding protein [Halobacteriota archaeon]
MSKTERIPFHIEISRIIELLAKQIYQSPMALLRENCQNAYDAILQRNYVDKSYKPEIKILMTPEEVQVIDNGIGMTKGELTEHYWKAGSSGKNNPEARAAGVVGTFGIGAMANFGIASEITVTTESAKKGERTTCKAIRETLSATEDCIDMISESAIGQPGTTVIAKIQQNTPIDIKTASAYIREIVRFLEVPVLMNGNLVSQEGFEAFVQKPPVEWESNEKGVVLGPKIKADVELVLAKNGEVWFRLSNIYYSDEPVEGIIQLRQGRHQIRTFRSRFALATIAVGSIYGFGGVADLQVLEPTAGREALTTESLQLLQIIVTESEKYISEKIAPTELSNSNTGFMEWAVRHQRFDLCSKLQVRIEPDNQSMSLEEIKGQSQIQLFHYFEGKDPSLINQYATEEKTLIVVSTRQPRRKCEIAYLQSYCNVKKIIDAPSVLGRKNENEWTTAEAAFAFRLVNILDSDYFVKVQAEFGKISHGLPIHVDTSKSPIDIIIDSDSSTMRVILELYREDYRAFSSMAKDFIRNVIFQRIANFVPSSTRQGADAFLRTIRRPRDILEYEKSDLCSFTEIWQDYLEGKISLSTAAQKSTTFIQTNVQLVDSTAKINVAKVLSDVLDNQRILEDTASPDGMQEMDALPAITRNDQETNAKLLIIEENERPLNGYRCFLAITNRVREERGDFFLQPHRTEIVWGGQKVLYIFQHHSGQFGLYYELQGTEHLSDTSGGRAFPTSTIVLKNQIYIPIPDEIRQKFIPKEDARKRFLIRCELLYPDFKGQPEDDDANK